MTELERAWEEGFKAGREFAGSTTSYPDPNPYKVVKPVPKTREEMAAFATAWDAKVEANR